MPVIVPTTTEHLLESLDEHPTAMLLAGGTDAMVEINDGRLRPPTTVIAVDRIAELRSWRHDPPNGSLRLGAAVTWTELADRPVAALVPALAEAARTVGSPQIRNAGTLGGNLATCSPAGDGLAVLAALDATVELVSRAGVRTVPVSEFMVGVKRTDLRDGEVIAAVTVPVVDGWQGYAKVGVRNAMVIAVAGACVVLDPSRRAVAVALGSVGPTVLRCPDAEAHLAASVDWDEPRCDDAALARFAELVADRAQPITDHRSTAEYRRRAVAVLARRLAARGLDRLRTARGEPS
jgi:CO/xanthine dehydrogenase FAD-binding subunit